jgi:5'-nucleotidase
MRIGIDLDSVLNDLDTQWAKWIADNHRPGFTLKDWTCWDVHTLAPCGNKVYDFLHLPGMFANLNPRPLAIGVTQDLVAEGHDLIVVTSCLPEFWKDKTTFLTKYFGHIHPNNWIPCTRKELVKMDMLIDDGVHNLKACNNADTMCVCFDRPWNQDWEGRRVVGWEEVPAAVRWAEDGKKFRPLGGVAA